MHPAPHRPESRAPDGAHCAEHRERPAHFTCGRCGSYACIACWHPAIERCQQCLKRDPTEAAPPIPWERPDRSLPGRFFATLGTAMRPVRSAPAFARDDVPSALRFMLLSALPLALLAGIIPHTRTLLFAGDFDIRVLGGAGQGAIAADVVRAMAVQLLLSAVEFTCLLLPFVSLVRAYAPARKHAATRMMLYRAWLLPGATLLFYVALWALPAVPDPAAQQAPPPHVVVLLLMRALVPVLLFVAMGSTARLACGLGPMLSVVVVIIPVVLLLFVNPLAMRGVEQLMPPPLEAPAE